MILEYAFTGSDLHIRDVCNFTATISLMPFSWSRASDAREISFLEPNLRGCAAVQGIGADA